MAPRWRSERESGVLARRGDVAEGRDGDLGGLISLDMRVQFPPPRPQPVRSMEGQRKDSGFTSRSWGFDSLTGYQVLL